MDTYFPDFPEEKLKHPNWGYIYTTFTLLNK